MTHLLTQNVYLLTSRNSWENFFNITQQYEWPASPVWKYLPVLERFVVCFALKHGVFIIVVFGLIETGAAFVLIYFRFDWCCVYVIDWVEIIIYSAIPVLVIVCISSLSLLLLLCGLKYFRVTGVTDIYMWVVVFSHIFALAVLLSLGIKGVLTGCQFPYLWLGIYIASLAIWIYFVSVVNSYRLEQEQEEEE